MEGYGVISQLPFVCFCCSSALKAKFYATLYSYFLIRWTASTVNKHLGRNQILLIDFRLFYDKLSAENGKANGVVTKKRSRF